MTEQTQPTDAAMSSIELMKVVMQADEETRAFALRGTTNWAAHIGKAVQNAVLAKWGTPAGAAPVMKERFSEPLARVINAGYLLANCAFNLAQRPGTEISIGTAQTLSDFRKEWDAACAAHKALPPAPQPTQAQAGAVPPLTKDELNEAAFDYSDKIGEQCDFRNGARWACDRFGVKGADHG